MVKHLLDFAKIDPERLHLDWASASEAARFTDIVKEFTQEIKALGPFEPYNFRLELQAMKKTVREESIRWLAGMVRRVTEVGNVYGEKITREEYDKIMDKALRDEYHRSLISVALKERPMSVRELDEVTHIGIEAISNYLTDLDARGEVSFHGFEGRVSKYITLAA